MKKIALLILLLTSASVFSQTQGPVKASVEEQSAQIADQTAEYPGGVGGFRKTVGQKIKISHIKGVRGIIESFAKFSVNINGEIEDLTVAGENKEFNKEVERAIRSMKTKWKPAEYKGTPVKMLFTLPFIANFE